MSKDYKTSFITYGSIISISHVADDNSFIYCDGFVKESVILRNHKQNSKNRSFFNNLFQIFPKFNNITKAEILKELNPNEEQEESGAISAEELLKGLLESHNVVNEDEEGTIITKDQIIDYQNKLQNEFKYNFDTFEKAKQLKITYKQPIQLLHLASSKFLACYQKESRFESSNYRVRLDDFPSEATLFKIIPAYKFQKEGEQIIYASDLVFIVRAFPFMNKETYIHASGEMGNFGKTTGHKNKQNDLLQSPPTQPAKQLKKQTTIQVTTKINKGSQFDGTDDTVIKREVNASVEDKTQWKITVFSEYISETQQYLKCGDVIWLHHSETNSRIAAARIGKAIDKNSFAKFNLAQWLSPKNLELKIIEGASRESYEEYIGDTYSMWVIEYEDFKTGGLVLYERNYRFRHLSSGMYLTGKPNSKGNEASFYLSPNLDQNTLFHFMPLKNANVQEKIVKKGSYVYICNANNYWFDVVSRNEEQKNQNPKKKTKSKELPKLNTNTLGTGTAGQIDNQEENTDLYVAILHQELHKRDESVFKLYASTSNDVWEISFVLSCIKILVNYLSDIKQIKITSKDISKEQLKDYYQKVQTATKCIVDLDAFCNNKLYNSTPEQKYDTINLFRQKLLREQFYIDILVKILSESMFKEDFEIWQKRYEIYQQEEQYDDEGENKQNRVAKKSNESVGPLDILGFVGLKVELCIKIYKLLSSICQDNFENELYTFALLPNIIDQARSIPESIDFMICLVKNNPVLLNKISEDLIIDFNFNTTGQFNDGDIPIISDGLDQFQSSHLQADQGQQVSNNPNLLSFFINLLEKEEVPHKAMFLRFLRSVCKYETEGINCNQENIYKLYKIFNEKTQKMGVVTIKGKGTKDRNDNQQRMVYRDNNIILPTRCTNKREMMFVFEQLLFYADLSFGRNFLWRKELETQFEQEFLFKNIWNRRPYDDKYFTLQPAFCKLAMSLYIDHDPLNRKTIPQFCRMYKHIEQIEQSEKNSSYLMNYNTLVDNLFDYLHMINQKIKSNIDAQGGIIEKLEKAKVEGVKIDEQEENSIGKNNQLKIEQTPLEQLDQNLLSQDILFNSVELLYLILELNLFEFLQNDRGRDLDFFFKQVIEIAAVLQRYDKRNQRYLAIMIQNQEKDIERKRNLKQERKNMVSLNAMKTMNPFALMSKLGGMVGNIISKPEEEDDDDEDDTQFNSNIDDVAMYTNPLIRGFIKLHNILEDVKQDDSGMSQTEIQLKLKICDIFDHFLNMRQEFLLSNILCFFKHYLVLGESPETKEEQQIVAQLQRLGKTDEEIQLARQSLICQNIIKIQLCGLLPNIPKTGIVDIDEPKKEGNDPFSSFSLASLNNLMNTFEEKKTENFTNFFNKKGISGIKEIYDLDSYFSLAVGDDDVTDQPIACLLPYLLSSIYFVHDEQLERRSLSVLMRIYNQRAELYQNLSNLQVIFDPQETQLFEILQNLKVKLRKLVDNSEIWLTDFIKKKKFNNPELDETLSILNSIRWAFFDKTIIEDGQIIIRVSENLLQVDQEKQQIMNSLNMHEPVISLIKDQMQQLIECIQDPTFTIDIKIKISELFINSFQFLKFFCKENYNNQMILYEYLQVFTNKMQYNLGQIPLICEIFKNNQKLLQSKVDRYFLQIFVELIETHGRQQQFLDPLITILRYRDKYIFDNQLQVLNLFLTSQTLQNSVNTVLLFGKDINPDKPDEFEFDFKGQVFAFETDFILELEEEIPTTRDNPYIYHKKLIDLLLQSTLIQSQSYQYNPAYSDASQKDNFTISVAKLKKTFKSQYLFQLLCSHDSLSQAETGAINSLRNKTKLIQMIKKPEQVEKPEQLTKEESAIHRGFSILKNSLCQFIRLVHITSEKLNFQDAELSQGFQKFVLFELERLRSINEGDSYHRYIDYLVEGVIPLFNSYFERILQPTTKSGQSQQQQQQDEIEFGENDDNKDIMILNEYARNLSRFISNFLYLSINKKRQVLILKKFFEQFPKTSFARLFSDLNPDDDDDVGTLNEPMPPQVRQKIMNILAQQEVDASFHKEEQIRKSIFHQHQHENQDASSPLEIVPEPQHSEIQFKQDSNLSNQKQQNAVMNQDEAQKLLIEEDRNFQEKPVRKAKKSMTPSQSEQPSLKKIEQSDQDLGNQKIKMTAVFSLMNKKTKKNLNFDIQQDEQGLLPVEQAESIENLWIEFRNQFLTLKIVQDEIDKEKEILADALIEIEKYIPQEKQKYTEIKLDFKLIAKKLINYLQYAVNNPKDKDTIITLLQVISKTIEKQNDDEKRLEIQDNLNKLGATRMVLLVLSESNNVLDSETYRYFIMFINTLLDGGNPKVQKTIYEFFTSYQKSEVIFQRFNQVIIRQIDQIQMKSKERKKAQQRKTELENEGEDQGEEQIQTTEQEIKQAKEDEQVMNQVLKFLQNCVEGHYLDLQNYIRHQTSSRNTYNMINLVADLLKAYYYEDRSQLMYDNMIRCLDTLNELVQGPCPENQIAVSESKFFEIASDLFSMKKEKDKAGSQSASAANNSQTKNLKSTLNASKTQNSSRKNKNDEDLEDWMLARLQMKCLILILSLIEQRELSEQNPIIKRIMRNLPMSLLQRLLAKQYKKYTAIYGQSYTDVIFNHTSVDPRDLDVQQLALYPNRYFETIIQNGFYIFFLMCYYMECDPQMENQFVQMYRSHRKKQLKQTQGTIKDLLFGDNIIGQILSFVKGLIESLLSILNQLKQVTYDNMMKNQQLTPQQLEKINQEKLAQKKRILRKSFTFFITNSATIEVIRNDQIELVYFYLLPHTHNLPKEKKIEFHELVDRSSTKSKIQGLMEGSERLIEICEHEEKLKLFFNRQKFLALFANYVKLWKDIAFIFTLILNIFIIGSFSDSYGDRMEGYRLFQKEQYTTDQTKNIFLICGLIMTCCSIFVVVFFLCKNAPLIITKAWSAKTPFEGPNQLWFMWFVVIIVKLITVLLFILKEIEVVYYLAYGTLAVIGTVVHPFFFAFHLTEILIRYPTLKNVIKAVWEPRQQLFLTLILFIILVYVYGLIGYTFFSDDYQGTCDSALYCFLYTFDYTFKSNGGVGGYLTGMNPDSVPKYTWGRFVFDNTSNIILVIIMVNIVAGIIIDTFGALREQENDKNRDIEDKCFVCGIEKTIFDRQTDNTTGGGFTNHIKINHYMWNYVFFYAYLKDKDHTEFTGIEQYVWNKIEKSDLNWYPFNKARELKQTENNEEEEITRVQKIQQDFSTIVENLDKASKAILQIRSQKHQ